MSIRSSKEIIKAKQTPVAQSLVEEMAKITDKLEDLQLEQQDYVDLLTYNQLCYKAYLHLELFESEAILYKQLCKKLGKNERAFTFSVVQPDKNKPYLGENKCE